MKILTLQLRNTTREDQYAAECYRDHLPFLVIYDNRCGTKVSVEVDLIPACRRFTYTGYAQLWSSVHPHRTFEWNPTYLLVSVPRNIARDVAQAMINTVLSGTEPIPGLELEPGAGGLDAADFVDGCQDQAQEALDDAQASAGAEVVSGGDPVVAPAPGEAEALAAAMADPQPGKQSDGA